MPLIFAFFMQLLGQSHAALPPNTFEWNCSSHAKLSGDAAFYFLEGRDSWEGQSILECHSESMTYNKYVKIIYHGSNMGFGVNQNSTLEIELTLGTHIPQNRLQIEAHVLGTGAMQGFYWRSQNAFQQIEVSVLDRGRDRSATRASLSEGNLFIQESR